MSESQPINILLIEDDLNDKDIICKIIKSSLNCRVTHIENFQETLVLDKSDITSGYDLIILDYNFPEAVSSNFLHVQKSIMNNECPIILLTGTHSAILKKNVEKYKNVYYRQKTQNNFSSLPSFINDVILRNPN